ncbi:hypothetical protein I316_02617 [Kwoniella heveanensis BCC8398]|uniref:Endopeptidase S2P n=1 Tax=Kwoniella heveanensis BCC8398 TaxID=1296120 RepID=A0A1B9GWZ8_9TREE|nr:hypothetical protein I316_02617 [Kwoniella heveanensis BCC8398]
MIDTLSLLPTFLLICLIALLRYISYHAPLTSSRKLTSPLYDPTHTKPWNFGHSKSYLNLSLWTSSFNGIPRSILNRLNIKIARRLKIWYNIGVGLGLLGLVVSLIGAVWSTVGVWKDVWAELEVHASLLPPAAGPAVDGTASDAAATLVKRAVMDDSGQGGLTAAAAVAGVTKTWGASNNLQPLIPGLTMPWSHLPTLVLALVINQLIHEIGHAISAALDDIQPARFNLSLNTGLPSMMVSFPSTVDDLDPNAKMRLAASGPYHNLLTWGILWLLAASGLGSVFWSDRSAEGRVVQEVHWLSPLYSHLHPGDLLVHLDDVPLSRSIISAPDPWMEYLTSTRIGDEGRGWCMDKNSFLALPHTPCHDPVSPTGQRSAEGELPFVSTYGVSKGEERCLSPHPILDIQSTICPCPDSRWVCVRPSAKESVLRIGLRRAGGASKEGQDEVILWDGRREEVLQAVKIRDQGARGWGGGVRWGEVFFGYISTIALSLFFFNLLPLPYTDGSQLLASLAQWRSTTGSSPSSRPASARSLQATLTRAPPKSPGYTTALVEAGAGGGAEGPSIKLYREYELDSDDEDEEAMVGAGEYSGGAGSGTRERTKEETWKRRLRISVQWCTMAVMTCWAVGWAMIFLLRSS